MTFLQRFYNVYCHFRFHKRIKDRDEDLITHENDVHELTHNPVMTINWMHTINSQLRW